jgi:TonB family protein
MRVPLTKALLTAILSVTLLPSGQAVLQRPQIFTGPDIGKIFTIIRLPDYPYEARKNSWSGRGTFRAFVEPSGKVVHVVVVKSTGHRELDDAVIWAAHQWRARPGGKREVDFPMAFIAPPRTPAGLP